MEATDFLIGLGIHKDQHNPGLLLGLAFLRQFLLLHFRVCIVIIA